MQMAGALRVGGGRRQYSGKMDLNGIRCIHVAYLIRPDSVAIHFGAILGASTKTSGLIRPRCPGEIESA